MSLHPSLKLERQLEKYKEKNAIAFELKRAMSLVYIDILKGESPVLQTLQFDEERIRVLRQIIEDLSIQSAIGILLKTQLGTSEDKIASFLKDGNHVSFQLSCIAFLEEHTRTDQFLYQSLQKIITKIFNKKESLFELFFNRLTDICRKSFIYDRYSLSNTGLEGHASKIQTCVVEPFEKIFCLNFKIYEHFYFQILSS